MKVLRGLPASPGIVEGEIYLYGPNIIYVEDVKISDDEIEDNIKSFHIALANAKKEIEELRKMFAQSIAEEYLSLLDAQVLFLEDEMVIKSTERKIKEYKLSAPSAFNQVFKELLASFRSLDNAYIKERISDITDISQRILRHLVGEKDTFEENLLKDKIIVAKDLTPSDTVRFSMIGIKGFALDIGGITSHTAIMARALGIPAVLGLKEVTKYAYEGIEIILDGMSGIVVVDPDEKTKHVYKKKREEYESFSKGLQTLRDVPAETIDGKRFDLSANIGIFGEIGSVKENGAKGIGLYRTEFLFLTKRTLPDEEEQFEVYKKIGEAIKPDSVIIRTIDLGGDKILPDLYSPEANPFLGWRGIRFSLSNPKIFKMQVKAILRAALYGNIRMMFPMISSVEEIIEAKNIIEECKKELEKDGIEYKDVEIGIMVEVPGAAIMAKELAKYVDFFSIGTNDLTQYTLAVDRTNERVAYLYQHLHPAVLRLVKMTVEGGHDSGIWVGVCGDIAGDPLAVPILVGMGVDELSVSPILVPEVKSIIRHLTMKEAQDIANKCLSMNSAKEVHDFLIYHLKKEFPVLASLIEGLEE